MLTNVWYLFECMPFIWGRCKKVGSDLHREEDCGRWNGFPVSREATSLTIISRLAIVHDHIKQPPIFFYIYITEWGEVITIIWRLPVVHDQIKRSPIFFYFYYFSISIHITEWGEVITIIQRLPIVHDKIERSPILYLVSFIFYFYFYITIEWVIFLYTFYTFIYLDCLVFSQTWKRALKREEYSLLITFMS